MNLMQNKLTQVYQEYLDYKNYAEKNKKTQEELRKQVTELVQDINDESYLETMFNIYGEKNLEYVDLEQLKVRLYHFYHAFKDIIEIPEEIKKEVENIDIKFIFTIKNGEKELIDKELYEKYKQEFIRINSELSKYLS